MSKSYQPWTQDQAYLLPPSVRDWLPEDHLAWFILEVVSQLDLSAIERAIQSKDSRGQRPYHPSMMVALLVYPRPSRAENSGLCANLIPNRTSAMPYVSRPFLPHARSDP